MALFDFLNSILGGSSQSVPSQPPQGGLLYPGAPSPNQQRWMDALGALSASLKDAGAFMQRQPEAATNLAAFNAQRQKRLQDAIGPINYNNMLLGMIAKPAPVPMQLFPDGLPPAAAAWLLLQRLQQNGSAAAQNQAPAPQDGGNPAQPVPAVPTPGANTGWSVERVQ